MPERAIHIAARAIENGDVQVRNVELLCTCALKRPSENAVVIRFGAS
jgi:hypothetical protein